MDLASREGQFNVLCIHATSHASTINDGDVDIIGETLYNEA